MSVPAAPESLPDHEKTDNKQRRVPYVIAVTSGKGGVGKSSIAVNLGISLAKTGARVCIFDADTGLANINILLGLTPKAGLEHVLFGAKSIEEIMLDGPLGVKIIPGANGISECVSLHPRQQLRLTRELARIEGDFDYLLLDTAAGIGDNTLDFVGSAQQSIIVITPEPTSLTDAFSLIKVMQRRRPNMTYQVIVNMCSNVAQAREVFHRFSTAVEKYIGARAHHLGYLLRDESMRVAVTLQSPVALFPESDPSSRSFIRLADALQKSAASQPANIGFSQFWQRQFRQQQAARERPGSAAALAEKNMAGNERSYLLELKARLLTSIAKPDAAREELSQLLIEVAQAYNDRFNTPAIDIAAALDSLLSTPQRNDHLLRQLAAKLRPWQSEHAAESKTVSEIFSAVTAMDDGSSFMQIAETSAPVNSPAQPTPSQRRLVVHHYDERRFGNQTVLLDLLQRKNEGGKTALELINLLVS